MGTRLYNFPAGVEDLSGGALLNPSEPINFHWIQTLVLQEEEAFQRREEEQVQQPQPPPFQPHDFGDETTVEHRFQMASFCWMQDASVHLGFPATYLAHQTDICAAAQRFRERYSGPVTMTLKPVAELLCNAGSDQDQDQFTKKN